MTLAMRLRLAWELCQEMDRDDLYEDLDGLINELEYHTAPREKTVEAIGFKTGEIDYKYAEWLANRRERSVNLARALDELNEGEQ